VIRIEEEEDNVVVVIEASGFFELVGDEREGLVVVVAVEVDDHVIGEGQLDGCSWKRMREYIRKNTRMTIDNLRTL
jgi:hypothetical protein